MRTRSWGRRRLPRRAVPPRAEGDNPNAVTKNQWPVHEVAGDWYVEFDDAVDVPIRPDAQDNVFDDLLYAHFPESVSEQAIENVRQGIRDNRGNRAVQWTWMPPAFKNAALDQAAWDALLASQPGP